MSEARDRLGRPGRYIRHNVDYGLRMIADTIREHLDRQPFEPFASRTSGGQAYRVANPDLVVVMKSKVFVAEPNSDRSATISYLHVATVESVGGKVARSRKRRG